MSQEKHFWGSTSPEHHGRRDRGRSAGEGPQLEHNRRRSPIAATPDGTSSVVLILKKKRERENLDRFVDSQRTRGGQRGISNFI